MHRNRAVAGDFMFRGRKMIQAFSKLVGSLLILLWCSSSTGQELPKAAERAVDFARDVRPLLEKHCWSCHGSEKQESGLRLDRHAALLEGGDSGKVVVPGNSQDSRLIHFVWAVDPDRVMPPEGDRLSAESVGVLRAWIDQGCDWPESESETDSRNNHWAYQPLNVSNPPEVRQTDWPVNGVDHFVLAELESRGLKPSPEADRFTLIRRLSLDVTGLLPSVAEVDSFVSDVRPEAWEVQVDRLLASPHFGERWGRHWLDMARYADSDGYEKDNPRPDAWRWRDWVIDAINSDMPFDQFTVEQLAGDLIPDATPMQRLATAFHRQTLTNTEGGTDQEQFRVEACFDRTETTGAVWLGLTVGCARCHSHKYDAISQREYYQLFAVFNNGDEHTTVIPKSDQEIAEYQKEKAQFDSELSAAEAELKEQQLKLKSDFADWEEKAGVLLTSAPSDPQVKDFPEATRSIFAIAADKRTMAQKQQLLDYFSLQQPATKPLIEKRDALKKKEPAKPELSVRVIAQRTKDPRTTYVLRRGEFLEPLREQEMVPAGLRVLPPMSRRNSDGMGDRLDLARWLVSAENPLPPRVTVNHFWRLLFGHGLVRTPSDFGVRGDRPTHPQLLDWLAAEFISGNASAGSAGAVRPWSRKAILKTILMSATYRQSSRHRPELLDEDPQNLFLARQNRLRVEGEIVRDISLDVAGLLSRKIGGPSVFPPLPPGIAELSYAGNFKWNDSTGEDRYRRGLYTFFKRTAPHPNLTTFDCPDANITCVQRQVSNTPLQALTSLNNDTFTETARAFAQRIIALPRDNDESRLSDAFRLCVSRPPSSVELQELLSLLKTSREWYRTNPDQAQQLTGSETSADIPAENSAAWVATARILLNLDEFITRE